MSETVAAINKVQKALETAGLTIDRVASAYPVSDSEVPGKYSYIEIIVMVPD
jgi:hypothetical protein